MDFLPISQQSQNSPAAAANSNTAQSTEAATAISANSAEQQAEDFDTFLTLLTAQISNQDPLEPVDSTQFVEQLATFSNQELQAKNNQILEGIADMLQQYVAPSGAGSSAPVSAANPENLI